MNECRFSPGLRRRCSLLILAVAFALTLTLLLAVSGYAACTGRWKATEFQVQNLDDETALITARFYDPSGSEVLSFTDSIAPGTLAYYQPESSHGLPAAFTGTLILESEQTVAGAVVHFASPAPTHHNGVTVYEMFDEAELGARVYAPLVEKDNDGFSSRLGVSNLGDGTAVVNVTIYDSAGDVASAWSGEVDPRGLAELDVGAMGELPAGFVGSAVIQADQAILAEVSRSSGIALASYSTLWGEGNELAAPLIPGSASESAVSAVATQNLGDRSSIMAQTFGAGCALCPGRIVVLDPMGNDFVAQTYTTSRPLYIFNNGKAPMVSVVTVDSLQSGEAGSAAYAAFDIGRLGYQAAAPLAFGGYDGWYTRIWVQNLGATTTTVTLTYTLLTSPDSFALSASEEVVGPGQTATFAAPTTPHASAIAQADQPIAMLVEGYNDSLALEDGRFYYRGTPYGAPLARFSVNSPVEPQETAYFENLSVAAVSFEWNFGDGARSDKENPAHTYHASGAHTVVMTATNPYGSATASVVVEAYGPPLASFESSSPDPLGQATLFANTSTGLPAPSGYQWDFGDGGVSAEENPSHAFTSFGRHWVVLTATNSYGSDTHIGWVDIMDEGLYVVYLPLLLKTFP